MRVAILFLLLSCSTYANQLSTTSIPHPLFLKLGFSSIVEFDANPIRVVVGDSQSFQVEKMDKSLVLRTLVPYATSNLFVYFKDAPTKLFTLTADEESNPSLYNKLTVNPPKAIKTEAKTNIIRSAKSEFKSGVKLTSATFDKSKDYLTVDFIIYADSKNLVQPKWNLIRLKSGKNTISPHKTWSERQNIQKDSSVKARLIFLRPNIEKSLIKSLIVIPLKGSESSFHLKLSREK